MPSPLIRALTDRWQLPVVDEATVDAFLQPAAGEPEHAVLFFTGNPKERAESDDVAVVLPEVLVAFRGRLRAAVVARAAEEALRKRFHVNVFPSLAVSRAGVPVGVLPKIRDWSEYREKIEAWLAPDAPALVASTRPRVEITHTITRGSDA